MLQTDVSQREETRHFNTPSQLLHGVIKQEQMITQDLLDYL